MSTDELTARVQWLEDRAELQELVARYSVARDDRDIAGLIGSFTPDAEFHRAGAVQRGREQITAFFRRSMDRYSTTLHTVHTQALDRVDADTVTGLVTGHAELALDGTLVVAAYRYDDRYRRHEGRWLIAYRSLTFMYAAPVEELATTFRDANRMRWPGQEPAPADWPETRPTWTTYLEDFG
jgi:uncharacterized protein (TIGR02246 family)